MAGRTMRVLVNFGDDTVLVGVDQDGRRDDYLVRPSPSDEGPAWRWEHAEKQVAYTACLGGDWAGPSCNCPWGRNWKTGKQECRHLAGVRVLIARGKLRCQ